MWLLRSPVRDRSFAPSFLNVFMIVTLLGAYLLGSIPFGLIFGKFFLNMDIRTIGSGNIGATNVLRSGHKKIALLTLLCDGLKGVFAVGISFFLQKRGGYLENLPMIAALCAVLGHVFPLWLKFKGGKGVATALGVLFALHSLLFCITSFMWLVTAKVFRISSLSALVAFGLTPVVAYILDGRSDMVVFLILLFTLLLWTHRSNIKRLLTGKETKIEG